MTSPASDELEISMFGRGFGESIAVHVGDGRWIVVDSFRDETGRPAALRYLESLAGEAGPQSVVAVVVTHWDDDHTKGMAEVIDAHAPSQVWMPAVLDNDEAFEFAVTHDMATASGPVPSGLKEFVAVVERVSDETRRWGVQDRGISTGTAATVTLLSPHDAVASRGFRALGITQRPGFGEISSPKPNDTSIALWVDWAGRCALLGADLEAGRWGWQAVLAAWPTDAGKAGALKVPHHGSPDAHSEAVFDRICFRQTFAGVTRYTPGMTPRPSDEDRDRIRSHVAHGWVIGAVGSSRRPPATPEQLHEETITYDGLWYPRGPTGQLRIRCDGSGEWRTQQVGAVELL